MSATQAPLTIVVTGDRDYSDVATLAAALDAAHNGALARGNPCVLITTTSPVGPAAIARAWASDRGVHHVALPEHDEDTPRTLLDLATITCGPVVTFLAAAQPHTPAARLTREACHSGNVACYQISAAPHQRADDPATPAPALAGSL